MTSVAMTGTLPPLPPGWTEHTAPTGHKYYYNASTKKSTYQRPTAEPIPQQTPPEPPIQEPEQAIKQVTPTPKQEVVVPLTEWSSEVAQITRPRTPERQTARMEGDDPWKKLEDRPRKKTDIPGAEPWVLVTTKWHRIFYYNPTTNESFWKIPPSIRDAVAQMQLEVARADLAAEESEEEESEDEYLDQTDPVDLPVEFTEEDVAYQLALMQSDYGGGAEEMIVEEEELDPTAKRQIFISLLEEKDINPFNTWESEMPKMVQDPRYSMLKNTKQRMEIFAEWARARIALIKEEKAQETKEDPKVGYLRYLSEKGDPKEYWFEFKRKHKKAPEYKHFGTDKLKEDLWRDWCARKKTSREKREADLLVWMRGLKGSEDEVMAKIQGDVRYWVLGDEKEDIVRDALRGR